MSLVKDLEKTLEILDKNIIISRTDTKGIITYVSSKFVETYGYSELELIGKAHNIVRHPDTPKEVFEEIWNTIQSGQKWEGVVKNLNKDGSYSIAYSIIEPEYDEAGNIEGYHAIREDITKIEDQKQYISSILKASDEIQIIIDQDEIIYDYSTKAKDVFRTIKKNISIGKFLEEEEEEEEEEVKKLREFIILSKYDEEIEHTVKIQNRFYNVKRRSLEDSIKMIIIFYDITDIIKQNEYTNKILDAQTAFTLITDGKVLRRVNQTTMDFFGYKTYEEFENEHDCICDFFIKEKGYLQKEQYGSTWLDIILYDISKINKVKMYDLENNEKTFQISTTGKKIVEEEEEEEEEVFVITLTDITESENNVQKIKKLNKDIEERLFESKANIINEIIEQDKPIFYNNIVRLVSLLKNNFDSYDDALDYLKLIYPTPIQNDIANIVDIAKFPYLVQKRFFDEKNINIKFDLPLKIKNSVFEVDSAILSQVIASIYRSCINKLDTNSNIIVQIQMSVRFVIFEITLDKKIDLEDDIGLKIAKQLIENELEEYVLESRLEMIQEQYITKFKILLEAKI